MLRQQHNQEKIVSWITDILDPIIWTRPYTAKYWLIDISKWNELDQAQMDDMKTHGLAGVWIQMVNTTWESQALDFQIDLCRNAKVPYGVYTWLNPTVDAVAQAKAGLKSYNEHAKDASNWMIDIEQEHESQIDSNTPHLSAQTIYDASRKYIDYLAPRISIPIAIYSGPNYLNNVCPLLKPLCKKYFYVNASYGTNNPEIFTWNQFAEQIKSIHASWIPTGFAQTDVKCVQWTSNWRIKNDQGTVYERLDFDAIQSKEVYETLFGGATEPPIPEPDGTVVVTASYALTVRARGDVNSQAIGYLKFGDVVQVLSKSVDGKWYYMHSDGSPIKLPLWPFTSYAGDGWISAAYTKPK
jgi:GH25 family lysozyme M1 (1,4-beta-N-acetylmuramidase)